MVSHGTSTSSDSGDQTHGMPGKSGETAEQVKEAASQVKEQAGQMTDQVKEQASKVTDKAKEQATTRVGDQKERAAQGIFGFADALHQVSGSVREQNPGVANFAETAASRLEHFAESLNDKDINDLIGDVEQLARRQPALFVGGAFLAGVVAARFLKSSSGMSGGTSNFQGGYGQSGYGAYDRRYSQRSSDYDTRGFTSQYGSQFSSPYGRPTGSTYGSTYGSSSGAAGYGTTRDTQTSGYRTGMTTGTTGGQDTPGAIRTGTGDVDASGRGVGTTGSTTSGQTYSPYSRDEASGAAGASHDRTTTSTDRDRQSGTSSSS